MKIIEAEVPKGCERNLGVMAYVQGYRDGQKRFYRTRSSLRGGGIEPPAPAIPPEFHGHHDAGVAYLTAESSGYELALETYEKLMHGGRARPPAPKVLKLGIVALLLALMGGCSCSQCGKAADGSELLRALQGRGDKVSEPRSVRTVEVERTNRSASSPGVPLAAVPTNDSALGNHPTSPACVYQADNLVEVKTRAHYFQATTPHPSFGFASRGPLPEGREGNHAAGDSINPHQFPAAGAAYTLPECNTPGG